MSGTATNVKLVAVGDGMVGKTSILMAYSTNKFPEDYEPTVFDNYQCFVRVDDETVSLGLWDTAGQEDYDRLRPLSYPQTDIFVIVFDLTNRASLNNVINRWAPEVQHFSPKTPMIVVGNKVDLRNVYKAEGKDYVSRAEGEAMARKCLANYVECSAKTMEGLSGVFDRALRDALENIHARNKPKKNTKCSIL